MLAESGQEAVQRSGVPCVALPPPSACTGWPGVPAALAGLPGLGRRRWAAGDSPNRDGAAAEWAAVPLLRLKGQLPPGPSLDQRLEPWLADLLEAGRGRRAVDAQFPQVPDVSRVLNVPALPGRQRLDVVVGVEGEHTSPVPGPGRARALPPVVFGPVHSALSTMNSVYDVVQACGEGCPRRTAAWCTSTTIPEASRMRGTCCPAWTAPP